MRSLNDAEMANLLQLVEGTRFYIPVLLAITGGLRRGELLALRWQDIALETGQAIIARWLEQTAKGVHTKAPKTERGRRTVIFPKSTVDKLRIHKKRTSEAAVGARPRLHI
jgi:integrase